MSYSEQENFTLKDFDSITQQIEAETDYNDISILQMEQAIDQLQQENSTLRKQNILLQDLCHKLSTMVDLPK